MISSAISGADPGFFQRGDCKYESSGKHARAKGTGEGLVGG